MCFVHSLSRASWNPLSPNVSVILTILFIQWQHKHFPDLCRPRKFLFSCELSTYFHTQSRNLHEKEVQFFPFLVLYIQFQMFNFSQWFLFSALRCRRSCLIMEGKSFPSTSHAFLLSSSLSAVRRCERIDFCYEHTPDSSTWVPPSPRSFATVNANKIIWGSQNAFDGNYHLFRKETLSRC